MEKERNGGKIFGTALLLVVAFAIGIFFGRNISEKQAANFFKFPALINGDVISCVSFSPLFLVKK